MNGSTGWRIRNHTIVAFDIRDPSELIRTAGISSSKSVSQIRDRRETVNMGGTLSETVPHGKWCPNKIPPL